MFLIARRALLRLVWTRRLAAVRQACADAAVADGAGGGPGGMGTSRRLPSGITRGIL
jgi:hypothetical protein